MPPRRLRTNHTGERNRCQSKSLNSNELRYLLNGPFAIPLWGTAFCLTATWNAYTIMRFLKFISLSESFVSKSLFGKRLVFALGELRAKLPKGKSIEGLAKELGVPPGWPTRLERVPGISS